MSTPDQDNVDIIFFIRGRAAALLEGAVQTEKSFRKARRHDAVGRRAGGDALRVLLHDDDDVFKATALHQRLARTR